MGESVARPAPDLPCAAKRLFSCQRTTPFSYLIRRREELYLRAFLSMESLQDAAGAASKFDYSPDYALVADCEFTAHVIVLCNSSTRVADSLARLHCVPPNGLGSASLHLLADSFARSALLYSPARLRWRCAY